MEKSISDYLLRTIDISNACEIYEVATLYTLETLREAAAEFIDRNALDIINVECFHTLSLVRTQPSIVYRVEYKGFLMSI